VRSHFLAAADPGIYALHTLTNQNLTQDQEEARIDIMVIASAAAEALLAGTSSAPAARHDTLLHYFALP
jgi:hypothetical protein